MNSHGPAQLPGMRAAAAELKLLGYASAQPGWAVITLEINRAMAVVHPELVPSFTAKWASMQVTFQPQCLAASLRVRLVGAVTLAEKSRVTCQVCGKRAAGVRAHTGREIEQALCAEHCAASRSGRVTAEALSFSTGVLDLVEYARRIGEAFRSSIRKDAGSAPRWRSLVWCVLGAFLVRALAATRQLRSDPRLEVAVRYWPDWAPRAEDGPEVKCTFVNTSASWTSGRERIARPK